MIPLEVDLAMVNMYINSILVLVYVDIPVETSLLEQAFT